MFITKVPPQVDHSSATNLRMFGLPSPLSFSITWFANLVTKIHTYLFVTFAYPFTFYDCLHLLLLLPQSLHKCWPATLDVLLAYDTETLATTSKTICDSVMCNLAERFNPLLYCPRKALDGVVENAFNLCIIWLIQAILGYDMIHYDLCDIFSELFQHLVVKEGQRVILLVLLNLVTNLI